MAIAMIDTSHLTPILQRTPRPSPLPHNCSLACWVLPGKYAADVMLNLVVS